MDLDSLLDGFTSRDWQTINEAEPIRLAVIGLGWWTHEEALPAIEQSLFCRTTVVVSGTKEKASKVAEANETVEEGITYGEFHDGAAVDTYDAVYICTPNATHPKYVETAARLGKDILCEKPMAATTEGGQRMIDACEKEDATLMIAYRMQTEPAIRRARDLLREGFIGTPIQVHGHMSDCVPELIPNPDQWRLDPELSGGATLIDIGLYPLNTTRFLLDHDPIHVYADSCANHEWFADLDEHITFQAKFENSVSAACTVSHNAHNVSHLRIIGSEGEITIEQAFFPWDDRELTIRYREGCSTIQFEQVNQMTEEFDYFAHCLITEADPIADGRHGLCDLKAVEAMYESAETGERIDLS